MFIVKKRINGKEYYYLQQSVRQGEKVISKTVAYLGKDKMEAEKKAKEIQVGASDGKERQSTALTIDEMAAFCKRKGFVYPSGEIYGSMAGFWDFGPVGSDMLKNMKDGWWRYHVHQREDIIGIDGSIITHPRVWKASGHVDSFVDVAVVHKKTGQKKKVDKHELPAIEASGEYEVKGEFNPMFTTQVGPVKDDSVTAYLRPETAQLIFANFKLAYENSRSQLPFGIAQIGKAFRNEISPREFLFRCREFEQMEIEYFIAPGMSCPYMDSVAEVTLSVFSEEMQKSEKEPVEMNLVDAWKNGIIKTDWHAYWMAQEFLWFISLGANPQKFRARQHTSEEKSHYALDTWDLEYKFPMGWRELQGFANRGDFDLQQHIKHSKEKLDVLHEGKKIVPHVVCEPSLGVGRAFLVFMFDAYWHDPERDAVVLRLDPQLAPIKAAVFPIVKNDETLVRVAREVFKDLQLEWPVVYDKSGSVGRRYARNDEIGTPFCITVDTDSVKNNDVTIRDRDTTQQIRVPLSKLKDALRKLIRKDIAFEKAGTRVETRVKE